MKEILTNVLALDSIVPFLKFSERVKIQQFRTAHPKPKDESKCQEWEEQMSEAVKEFPFKIQKAIQIVKLHKWNAPECKYNGDREVVFYNEENEQWQLLRRYKHPILTEIEKLK